MEDWMLADIKMVCKKHKLMLEKKKNFKKLGSDEMSTKGKLVICDGPVCLEDAAYVVEGENLHEKIGTEIQGLGGRLECTKCGNKKSVGNVAYKLKNGWPKCCGYTMRWKTQKELEGELNE